MRRRRCQRVRRRLTGAALPVRGLIFGLAVIAALDATGFEIRRHGAATDMALIRAQALFWLLRGLIGVICAIGLLIVGRALALVAPFWLAPILLAAGSLVAFAAASSIAFARRSE